MPREIAARTKHRAMLFLPMTREVFGAEAGLALDADDERRHASGGRFRDIDRLERQIGIQTFNAALDAETRLLVRGERHLRVERTMLVDPDAAAFEPRRDFRGGGDIAAPDRAAEREGRSGEHTSELQSLMRTSYS